MAVTEGVASSASSVSPLQITERSRGSIYMIDALVVEI
jgi:hypothetical protein